MSIFSTSFKHLSIKSRISSRPRPFSDELTNMMYYGCDGQYDYFTRGFSRLKVAKSEKAIPDACRFTFNNWTGGKKYTDCVKDAGASQVQSLLNLLKPAQ